VGQDQKVKIVLRDGDCVRDKNIQTDTKGWYNSWSENSRPSVIESVDVYDRHRCNHPESVSTNSIAGRARLVTFVTA
jgi:hypothetical protein